MNFFQLQTDSPQYLLVPDTDLLYCHRKRRLLQLVVVCEQGSKFLHHSISSLSVIEYNSGDSSPCFLTNSYMGISLERIFIVEPSNVPSKSPRKSLLPETKIPVSIVSLPVLSITAYKFLTIKCSFTLFGGGSSLSSKTFFKVHISIFLLRDD